ncbi:MAG: hypothetical protein K5859_05895 [Atopobiaceae bacterium]|nr:hypothetical protein [Atopobiaceae bacterium]
MRAKILRPLSAALLAIVLVLGQLAASITVTELHDHECVGDDCPACTIVHAAETLLSVAAALAVFASSAALAAYPCIAALALWVLVRSAETPVTSGVELLI